MIDVVWIILSTLTAVVIAYVYSLVRSTGDGDATCTSLDAYISEGDGNQEGKKKSKKKSRPVNSEAGRQILVVFATEYGFSEELAALLVDRIQTSCDATWQPRHINAKHYEHIQWDLETIGFFVISTSGDGVPPTDSIPFMDFLQQKEESLQHLCISILALGDSSYPHFCRAGEMLEQRLQRLDAKFVIPTAKVDGENWKVIEGWMSKVTTWVNSDEALKTAGQLRLDYLDLDAIEDCEDGMYSRNNPFLATVKTKRLLTQVEDRMLDRETIHCELDISESDLQWTAGDALGICPTNNPGTVGRILALIGASGTEELMSAKKPAYRGEGAMTLQESLLWYYDIKRVTPSTLSTLRRNMQNSGKDIKMMQQENYLETRELVHVLQDWYACTQTRLSLEDVCTLVKTLRPLQPRYYSISSSPLLNSKTVAVTVAVVRYATEHGPGEGVTTTHLQDHVEVGDKCPVFISVNPGFRLPSDSNIPIVCIGAGTGLAPYRAFIQERELSGSKGTVHLYFGCRHPDKDFLYRDTLERLEAEGTIRLRVAFSRYHGKKVYVQDLVKEDAALLWSLVQQGTVVYVCGDATGMAPDVHKALLNIVQEQGHLTPDDSQDYLDRMERDGRYLKDVW